MKYSKSSFFGESFNRESIILKENNETVTDNYKLAEKFDKLFSNVVQNLDINSNLENVTRILGASDPILSTIRKYENHPSILRI